MMYTMSTTRTFLVLYLFIFFAHAPASAKKKKKKRTATATTTAGKGNRASAEVSATTKTTTTLFNGVAVQFSDEAATPQLMKWARALSTTDGSVTHGQAVSREQYVVSQVNSGKWGGAAYHEYQRLAAGSGNVDSARLLIEYGVAPVVSAALADPAQWPLHASAARCDISTLRALLSPTLLPPSSSSTPSSASSTLPPSKEEGALVFVDSPLPDGTTALAAAALAGCSEGVEVLVLEFGADTELAGAHGATPLMVAAGAGEALAVAALLRAGADPNARHKFAGHTALHMAAENDWPLAVRAMCSSSSSGRGASVDIRRGSENGEGSGSGRGEDGGGVEVNAASLSTGGTPLHSAVDAQASAAVIHALLRERRKLLYSPRSNGRGGGGGVGGGEDEWSYVEGCGADPDALMNNDTTALYLAADQGLLPLVEALLENGANPNRAMPIAEFVGGNALERRRHQDSYSFSSGAGNDDLGGDPSEWLSAASLLNSQPANGATPLHAAAERGHLRVVEALLNRGANANDASMGAGAAGVGVTPLHSVAMHAEGDAVGCVRALVLQGRARVNAFGGGGGGMAAGATPLYYAVGVGGSGGSVVSEQLVSSLLELGADPDRGQQKRGGQPKRGGGGEGGTPLVFACLLGQTNTVKLLLSKGADGNLATTDSHPTPANDGDGEEEDTGEAGSGSGGASGGGGGGGGIRPIHAACFGGHANVVTELLAHSCALSRAERSHDDDGDDGDGGGGGGGSDVDAVATGVEAGDDDVVLRSKEEKKKKKKKKERRSSSCRHSKFAVDPDALTTTETSGGSGGEPRTALQVAVAEGQHGAMQALLSMPPMESEIEEPTTPPLQGKARNGATALHRPLLNVLYASPRTGATALHLAAEMGDATSVKLLLDYVTSSLSSSILPQSDKAFGGLAGKSGATAATTAATTATTAAATTAAAAALLPFLEARTNAQGMGASVTPLYLAVKAAALAADATPFSAPSAPSSSRASTANEVALELAAEASSVAVAAAAGGTGLCYRENAGSRACSGVESGVAAAAAAGAGGGATGAGGASHDWKRQSSLEVLRLLLTAGARPDAPACTRDDEVDEVDDKVGGGGGGGGGGVTPLLASVEGKDAEVVALLLAFGADPNRGAGTPGAGSQDGGNTAMMRSPLLFSVVSGCAVCAGLLLNSGANCQVVVGSRAEPLTLADLARRRRDHDTLHLLTSEAHKSACDVDLSQL